MTVCGGVARSEDGSRVEYRPNMHRSRFLHGLFGAAFVSAALASLAPLRTIAAPDLRTKIVSLSADVDRLVVRGSWRAYVALGDPHMTIIAPQNVLDHIVVERSPSRIRVLQVGSLPLGIVPELLVTMPRLRGLATSGEVALTLADHSDTPLFLDLAGATSARATGSVPLLRITTSGVADVDLTGMPVRAARVHARQSSRLAIRVQGSLTIAALGVARVTYAGTGDIHVTKKGRATVTRR